jgi:hypothetical protein
VQDSHIFQRPVLLESDVGEIVDTVHDRLRRKTVVALGLLQHEVVVESGDFVAWVDEVTQLRVELVGGCKLGPLLHGFVVK